MPTPEGHDSAVGPGSRTAAVRADPEASAVAARHRQGNDASLRIIPLHEIPLSGISFPGEGTVSGEGVVER
jgi:hypothetical protein